jgi:hypothetical protein
MPVPDFVPGEVLTAAAMDSIGLWLVKTQTVGTGVASVVVSDAFSSNYDNYRITYTGGVMSGTNVQISMRLGAAVTQYYYQMIYQNYASNTAPLANVPDNNSTQWSFVGAGTTTFTRLSADLFNPFLATRTVINGSFVNAIASGSGAGVLNDATSYTAFTLLAGSGTMTGGTIRVYGYRN